VPKKIRGDLRLHRRKAKINNAIADCREGLVNGRDQFACPAQFAITALVLPNGPRRADLPVRFGHCWRGAALPQNRGTELKSGHVRQRGLTTPLICARPREAIGRAGGVRNGDCWAGRLEAGPDRFTRVITLLRPFWLSHGGRCRF